jgi:hypothetical protein
MFKIVSLSVDIAPLGWPCVPPFLSHLFTCLFFLSVSLVLTNICQAKNVPQPPFSLSLASSHTHITRNHDCTPARLGDAALSITSSSVDIAPLGWLCRGQAMRATFPLLSLYLPFLSLHFSCTHKYLSSKECATTSLLSFPRLVLYTHNMKPQPHAHTRRCCALHLLVDITPWLAA